MKLLVILTLLALGSAVAQTQPEASSKPSGGEGVTIHGHWIIDVRNPDGKVVQHRDFENALNAGTGETALLLLVSSAAVPGDIAIGAVGGDIPKTDICTNGEGDTCLIVASASQGVGGQLCPANASLCATGLAETQPGATVTLTGNMPVAESSTVGSVSTIVVLCSATPVASYPNLAPSQCFALVPGTPNITASVYTLTSATLGAPLSVTAGQTLVFQVVLSFS